MNRTLFWKFLLVVFVTAASLVFTLPSFFNKSIFGVNAKINLGLDLKGGSHILLKVGFDTYLKDRMELLLDDFRKNLRKEKIFYQSLKYDNGGISFSMKDATKINEIKKIIQLVDSELDFFIEGDFCYINYNKAKISSLHKSVVEQSIEIIRKRVDSSGTKEPTIQRQGVDYILLQIPGVENAAEMRKLLGTTAKLTFHLLDPSATEDLIAGRMLPLDSKIVIQNYNGVIRKLVVKKKILLAGDSLLSAELGFDRKNTPVVDFSLNRLGTKIFADITAANVGRQLAIILDDELLSAPNINEPIKGGRGFISGFTIDSANELALMLRAGALPAPLKIVEERSIGPNLGADSIVAGKKASIIGFISVTIFMLLAYGVFGIFAGLALAFNLIYIMAALACFNATLTLPGIAGIILTIGMAVDANVLIYERIKEEIKLGASIPYSIRQGFNSAFSTIADSNITTLSAAILLYIFGVGTIKGFAVTLSIGIIISMFTAIFITRLQIELWIKFRQPKAILS